MKKRKTILTALTRNVIDFCMVPGTSIGAEILWLYSLQWQKKISLLLLAMVSFGLSHMTTVERTSASGAVNERENTK